MKITLIISLLFLYCCLLARFEWRPDDPEIVSDVLFAVANVLSIARTTYLMPAFEVLGTLQISLGRMIGDIKRFLVLFTLVCNGSNNGSLHFFLTLPVICILFSLHAVQCHCWQCSETASKMLKMILINKTTA